MDPLLQKIIWVAFVAAVAALLLFLVRKGFNRLAKRDSWYGQDHTSTFNSLRRVFSVFILLIAVLLVSYVFFEKKVYVYLNENLLKVIYLSIIIPGTLVFSIGSKLVFDRMQARDGSDATTYKFMRYLAVAMIYFIGIFLASFAFPKLQAFATSALAGAGIMAVVIGFASQEAISNIIGGIFIVLYKPFRIGHVVKLSENLVGEVEDITLRHTVIKNYQNKRIIVPNAMMNKERLVNYDLGEKRTCSWVEVGISYSSSIEKAKELVREECMKHPALLDTRTALAKANGDPVVIVRVISLDDSAVTIRAWTWAKDYPTAFVMKCELLESIKLRFDAEGIEIPFPHRTVYLKREEGTTNIQLKSMVLSTG
ncbi:MAG: mechanosensitive ion channel family protein [Flavobacteriales bacterium]|nr:mechanosensitive ion channel family protein [Flavobacteriales bacterium]